jgi:hypothetical protein
VLRETAAVDPQGTVAACSQQPECPEWCNNRPTQQPHEPWSAAEPTVTHRGVVGEGPGWSVAVYEGEDGHGRFGDMTVQAHAPQDWDDPEGPCARALDRAALLVQRERRRSTPVQGRRERRTPCRPGSGPCNRRQEHASPRRAS